MKENRQFFSTGLKKAIELIAPGTGLREGIDNLVDAKLGGLIYYGDIDEILPLIDGGFLIDVPFSPNHLYELGKMDGALILSSKTKRIVYANCQLIPNYTIATQETGTRHRTAERVAKMTSGVVISISERRNRITLYHQDDRYVMRDMALLVNLAAQGLEAMETARKNFDEALSAFLEAETEGRSNYGREIGYCLSRGSHLMELYDLMEEYLLELGKEGELFVQAVNGVLRDVDEQMEDLRKLVMIHEMKMV